MYSWIHYITESVLFDWFIWQQCTISIVKMPGGSDCKINDNNYQSQLRNANPCVGKKSNTALPWRRRSRTKRSHLHIESNGAKSTVIVLFCANVKATRFDNSVPFWRLIVNYARAPRKIHPSCRTEYKCMMHVWSSCTTSKLTQIPTRSCRRRQTSKEKGRKKK